MSRTVTLTVLLSDVRTKGDFAGATVRHTDAQITRLLNQSIQRFRERISDEGSEAYLVSSTGTLGIGPTSPFAFYQLDLSALSPAMVRVFGIDVTFPGGESRTLDRVPFEMRSKYGTTTQGGTPLAWAPFKRDQVAILPASSAAYPYTVWYLPVLADLATGSDTFDGVAGWEDFIVWDVVVQLIARDQFPQAYGIAVAQRDGVWTDILRGATKVTQAGGAHLGRDSFGGKLPLFLGGRRPVKVAAGGPVTPASGSVTNQMLADMTGPTVKGVMSGTTRPQDVQVATLTTYLGLFNTAQRGLVPPPVTTSNLFLRDDGTWASAAGAGQSVGASGAIQFQGGAGSFGNASGFAILGTHPSLIARLDGSMRVTGGQVEVGSGTTKIQATGIDMGNGSIVNVATLVTAALSAPAFTDTTAGLAPASGGGTSNFLRADGAWAAGGGSAAGSSGAIQYSDGVGGFVGSTLLSIQQLPASFDERPAISFGDPNITARFTIGDIRTASGFILAGNTPSGGRAVPLSWSAPATVATGGSLTFGSLSSPAINQALRAVGNEIATGGVAYWRFAGGTATTIRATGTLFPHHVHANTFSVGTGIQNDQLHPMASGTVKANLGPTGQPADVSIPTLLHYSPTFTASQPGYVPPSGGGTTNFLRADGTWTTPAAGAAVPSGITASVQFNNSGAFEGATGITVVASGQAFAFGPNPAAAGTLRFTNELGVLAWARAGGGDTIGAYLDSSNNLLQGAPNGGFLAPNNQALYTATGGTFFLREGSNEYAFAHGAAFPNTLTLGSGLTNANLYPMGSGTVKGRLSGTGAVQDIAVQTMLAFAPTFTATKQGVVPPSGGGTSNYLRADGAWDVPPGGSATQPSGITGSVQFRGAAGFEGATGITVVASGQALAFGAAPALGIGVIRGSNNTAIVTARNAAGDGDVVALSVDFGDHVVVGGTDSADSKAAKRIYSNVGPTGLHILQVNSTDVVTFSGSGVAMPGKAITAGPGAFSSVTVSSGIGNAFLDPIGSGMFKGRISGTGAVQDVAVQTMLAFAPTFTATKQGVVPPSGGGTTNYLRADGTWGTPPGTAGNPGGGDTALQFYSAGNFGGATGLHAVANGQALGVGVPSFHPGFGDVRVASGFNITANLPSGIAGVAATQRLFDWSGGGASGVLKVGGASGILGTNRHEVATGGAFEWLVGGQTGMSLRATGLDAPGLHVNAKSFTVGHVNGLPADANQLKRGIDIGNSSGLPSGLSLYLPRGVASGANRFLIPSGTVGTGTQAAPRFVTLSPTGGRGGATIRIERVNEGGWPFEVRTPTGTVLHSFPSGTKGIADFVFEKPSGAVFQLGGFGDLF